MQWSQDWNPHDFDILIKVTLNCMTLMQHKFLDLPYGVIPIININKNQTRLKRWYHSSVSLWPDQPSWDVLCWLPCAVGRRSPQFLRIIHRRLSCWMHVLHGVYTCTQFKGLLWSPHTQHVQCTALVGLALIDLIINYVTFSWEIATWLQSH